ncbi:hypothetical protein O0L34_g9293 [Tuta absoluta]|nr:hypothetical protein O0L34_g9293 [Tuta absoluta]
MIYRWTTNMSLSWGTIYKLKKQKHDEPTRPKTNYLSGHNQLARQSIYQQEHYFSIAVLNNQDSITVPQIDTQFTVPTTVDQSAGITEVPVPRTPTPHATSKLITAVQKLGLVAGYGAPRLNCHCAGAMGLWNQVEIVTT